MKQDQSDFYLKEAFLYRMTSHCSRYEEYVANNRVILIREAKYSDCRAFVQMSNGPDGGWFSCLGDLDIWKRSYAGRLCILAAVVKDTGETIGLCSGLKLDKNIGFIGNYFVKKSFRGGGIGFKLWNRINEYLEGTNKCLVSVPEMVAKYNSQLYRCSKSAIVNCAAVSGIKVQQLMNQNDSGQWNHEKSFQLVKPSQKIIEKISSYDTTVSHLNRKEWCSNWLMNHASGRSLVALNIMSAEDGKNDYPRVAGFGQIREVDYSNVVKISPLYADNEDVAKEIFFGLIKFCPNIEQKEIKVYYLQNDLKMKDFLEGLCFEKIPGSMPLMFTKCDLDYNADKVFFLAEPEMHFP